MLKLGEKLINKIYLGDKAISKVYWGEKLVYNAVSHTEIEYLEGNATSFIDTGVIGKSGVSIDMEIEFPSRMSGHTYFVGCSQGSNGVFYVPFLYNGGRWSLYINNSYGKYGAYTNPNTKYHVVTETTTTGATLYIDGVQQATSTASVTSGSNTMYLFGVNNGGTPLIGNTYYTDSTGYIKISACKINVDGTLVRDYIPVERTDGVKCLFDKVESKYYEFQTA